MKSVSQNREKEIIQYFLSQLPGNKDQLNRFFESDAEIIKFGSENLLFTTDEFSAEDLFRDHDPYILGWNVAACTISDILASGGTPKYYAHSVHVANSWDKDYIINFSKGIAAVLDTLKIGFIGGDLGISNDWRYTGICIGTSEKPLTRKGTLTGDQIYMTGKIGAGNLEAAMNIYSGNKFKNTIGEQYQTKFPIRMDESVLIRKYGVCCIDTSDGLINALNTITELNNTGYEVKDIPFMKEGEEVCKYLSLPVELLMIGECGEYELLFTIHQQDEKDFLEEATRSKYSFSNIGKITENIHRMYDNGSKKIYFDGFNIAARSYKDLNVYLRDLIKFVKNEG